MNKEEIESLFKKYKVRIPKEKQGQSECYECKRHHKYSLTWTSFLYEYKENYYCFEHIVNILLQQENKKQKEVIDKAIEYIESKNNGVCIINGKEKEAFTFLLDFDEAREFIWKLLDILKEVE